MTNLIEASMKGSSKPAIARRAFTAHSAFEASAVLEHEQGSSNPQAETERCGDEDRETRTKASELRLDFDRGGGLHNQRMLAQESLPLLFGPADNRARDGRALLVEPGSGPMPNATRCQLPP